MDNEEDCGHVIRAGNPGRHCNNDNVRGDLHQDSENAGGDHMADTASLKEILFRHRYAVNYHLQPTSQVREGNDNVMYRTYRLLRGSHTYNTEEMARLIDGMITMCKEAGIPDREIATPEEKRLLKPLQRILHIR